MSTSTSVINPESAVRSPRERLKAAKSMSTAEVVALPCPSAEFEADYLAINKKIAELTGMVQRLQRRLELAHKERDVLELEGKDPIAEIRQLKKSVADAESQIQRGRSELFDLFSAEKTIFELKKNAVWTGIYQRFVLPFQSELGEQFEKFKSALQAICDEVVGSMGTSASETSQFSTVLAGIDESASKLNAFVAKTSLSPQQFAGENSLRNNLSQSVRQVFTKLPLAEINKIFAAIGLEQLKTKAQHLVEESQRPSPATEILIAGKKFGEKFMPEPKL